MAFVKICSEKDIPIGSIRQFEHGEKAVAISNVDGKFYAINGHCTHHQAPIGEGELDGTTVTCPWHGAQFDVRTGKVLAAPATSPIACFKIKVEKGEIHVDL